MHNYSFWRNQSIMQEHFITYRDIPLLELFVHECTEFTLLAIPLFAWVLLARICFILVWMIESLECGMWQLALVIASRASVLVVVLALIWQVIVLVGATPEVKRLVCIHTVVPIMILRLVSTKGCLVPIHIEHNRINCF